MEAEALDEEVLWQEVICGHLKWTAEIEERLRVKIEVVLTGYGHIFDHGKIFGEPSDVCTAKAEMIECERNVEQMYYSLTLLQHDPIRRGASYHDHPELLGRTPWQAIMDSGIDCIDVVLIGPSMRAAAMLAQSPQLYAAAKARALHAHELDEWTPHVRGVLAQADTLRAAMAIEDALTKLSMVEGTCAKWLPQADGGRSSKLLKESFK
jgi:hypothetical protein